MDVRIHQTTKWTANGNHLQSVPLIRCGLRTTQGRFSHPAESLRPDNNNELETIGLIYSHSTGEQGAVFRATAALRPPPPHPDAPPSGLRGGTGLHDGAERHGGGLTAR